VAKNLQTNISIGGKLLPSLMAAFNTASAKVSNLQNKSSLVSKVSGVASKTAGLAMIGLGTAAGAAAVGVGALGIKGIKLASDLNEVQNVVDVTFGTNASQINQWSKAALNAFGLSELQAKQFTGSMGAMLKSSGIASEQIVSMSGNMAGLAGDFASFYNLEHQEAWEKIRSGISGETEPLTLAA